MQKSLLSILGVTIATLCGCAQPLQTAGTPPVPLAQSFSCQASDSPAGRQEPRLVTVTRDPAQPRLQLSLGDDRTAVLEPVPNSSGQLFASSEFAWRVGANGGVLTDVERIQTYACDPVSNFHAIHHVATR